MRGCIVLAATALLLGGGASAHERWANGEPVPAWVKRACCSQAHAHHITNEAPIHEMSDGLHIDGYSHVVPYETILPSPDGSTWLFYSTNADGSQNAPYCVFRGVKGS